MFELTLTFMASSPMLPPPLSLSLHRHLLYRSPPLPELYPGGAATTSRNPPSSSPSPSSPFLIPFFVVFISLLFFLLGFLMRDVFSFLHPSPSPPKRKTGISETILNSFPVLPYCNLLGTGFGSVSSECLVCLSEFERDDNVRLVTVCGHGFHKECVDNWLESHFTCPVCRADLRNEPDRRVVTGVCEVLSEE